MVDALTARSFCPRFHRAAELVGKRWSAAAIRALLPGPLRFNALQASIPGVSARMLSERLAELEDEGVVQREVSARAPVRVTYALTPKGRALARVVDALTDWAHHWTALRPGEGRDRGHARATTQRRAR